MINAKSYVRAGLVADAAIIAAVGSSERIIFEYPQTFESLPLITYTEVDQHDGDTADNQPYAWRVIMQVDVWVDRASGTTTTLSGLVADRMQALGFSLSYSSDVPDPDERILHKVLRFAGAFMPDDLDVL